MRRKLETTRQKAVYLWEILNKLNPGVFETPEDVLLAIGQRKGSLFCEEKLEQGAFESSGMIRVQYDGDGRFSILIDPYIEM